MPPGSGKHKIGAGQQRRTYVFAGFVPDVSDHRTCMTIVILPVMSSLLDTLMYGTISLCFLYI